MACRFILFSLFAAVLAALVFAGSPGSPASAAVAGPGDADCSGTVDGHDALDILLTLGGELVNVPPGCSSVGSYSASYGVTGDANCDRQIDVRDVLATLEQTAGVTLPPCYSETLSTTGTAAQVVGADGGTLTATGSDGSAYTLTIPAGALLGREEVQMTPLTALANLPLSGGLVAGVDLQPSGMLFWVPATLSITPGTAVAANDEVAFQIIEGQYSLADVMPQAGAAQIALQEIPTAAGIGSGELASASPAAVYVPSAPGQALLADARVHLQTARHDELTDEPAGATSELAAWGNDIAQYYTVEIAPNLTKATTDCEFSKTFIPYALSWARTVELMGGGTEQSSAVGAVMSTMVSALNNCFNEAYTRCTNHDLTALPDMLSYAHQLVIIGGNESDYMPKINSCATFKLEFDSELCLAYQPKSIGDCSNGIDVAYTAPDVHWSGVLTLAPLATGPMTLVKAVGAGSATSDGSTFAVIVGGVHVNVFDPKTHVKQDPQVSLVIQPGQPIEHWAVQDGTFDAHYWYDRFCAIHANELVGFPTANQFTCLIGSGPGNGSATYRIDNWQLKGGELYAEKDYMRTYGGVTTVGDGGTQPQGGPPPDGWEVTTLKLYHEPGS